MELARVLSVAGRTPRERSARCGGDRARRPIGEGHAGVGMPRLPDPQVRLDLHPGPLTPGAVVRSHVDVASAFGVTAVQAERRSEAHERRLDRARACVADACAYEAERGAHGD